MSDPGRLLVFAKAPRAGSVKTRLIPALGADGAARLARALLIDTWALANEARGSLALEPALVVTGTGDLPPLEPAPELWPQGDGDLGARLERAFRRALERAPFAIAIGSDAPWLPLARLAEARALLASGATQAVLSPAQDGGYTLIGLRQCPQRLFADLPWSSEQTLARTRERLNAFDLSPALLATTFDLDAPEDLEALRAHLHANPDAAPATRAQLARS